MICFFWNAPWWKGVAAYKYNKFVYHIHLIIEWEMRLFKIEIYIWIILNTTVLCSCLQFFFYNKADQKLNTCKNVLKWINVYLPFFTKCF